MAEALNLRMIQESLPEALFDRFRNDGSYLNDSWSAARRMTDWFMVSGVPFFKDYTDHSELHSLEVFSSAAGFISADSYQAITAADLATLLISCYLHDAGMHITEDQFLILIDENHTNLYNNIDRICWPQLWSKFTQEASRFNEDKLVAIFGDISPIPELPQRSIDFTNRHRLLVGEFLRQHHPRIAHDLALGMDTHLGLSDLLAGYEARYRDLVGYIARSHGIGLRKTLDYVTNEFDIREFNKVHIVYIMVLLRIADYAQIQATRAPRLSSKIHSLPSPISRREWRVHQSVVNITQTHDDPEALLIDSRPTKVIDFLRVKDWLTDLQNEMDKSWAVLGEIYGRQTASGLDNLKLSIRRIRSEILNGYQTREFIPERISFRVAETEMLKLLLAPLYGDHPGYGVRELIQNSHDAIVEILDIKEGQLDSEKGKIRVCLISDEENSSFVIEDNGVGMALNTIRDYFLNAGASFRASQDWKSAHLDEEGHSKIARSGRFGVGALAAFLIGPQIKVTTRPRNQPEGYVFTTTLHEKAIEVRPTYCNPGTRVEIKSNPENIKRIASHLREQPDFYNFDESSIEMDIEISEEGKTQKLNRRNTIYESIFEFSTSRFPKVKLMKLKERSGREANYVNGIRISPIHGNYYSFDRLTSLYSTAELFVQPDFFRSSNVAVRAHRYNLEIVDKDAFAPINLSRTAFSDFDEEITEIIDGRILDSFIKFTSASRNEIIGFTREFTSLTFDNYIKIDRAEFISNGDDIIPNDVHIISKLEINTLYDIGKGFSTYVDTDRIPSGIWIATAGHTPESPSTIAQYIRDLRHAVDYGPLDYIAVRLMQESLDSVLQLSKPPKWIVDEIGHSKKLDGFCLLEFGVRNEDAYQNILKLSDFSKSPTLGVYYSKKSDFSTHRHYSPYRKGALAESWLSKRVSLK